MSYCRFGEADAYIYDDINNGIVCMACSLMTIGDDSPFPDTFIAGYDRQKMLDHIAEHRYIGDRIPFDVDKRLKEEMTHDPLCPCNNADERGCFLISAETNKCVSCECDFIAKIRNDIAQKIKDYAKAHHEPHPRGIWCKRCDITAAYGYASSIALGVV